MRRRRGLSDPAAGSWGCAVRRLELFMQAWTRTFRASKARHQRASWGASRRACGRVGEGLDAVPFALAVLGVACILATGYVIRRLSESPAPRIYWGAWIAGSVSGHGDAPWDMRSVSAFERQAGKGVSIIHFGQPWYTNGVPQPFYPQPLDAVREHGAIPLVDWGSWEQSWREVLSRRSRWGASSMGRSTGISGAGRPVRVIGGTRSSCVSIMR